MYLITNTIVKYLFSQITLVNVTQFILSIFHSGTSLKTLTREIIHLLIGDFICVEIIY